MQLSPKPTLSLVRSQHWTADQVGTLVPWIARGDEAAFRLFFEATNGLLFGLLLRILGHTQTAEEVLSELYEEVRRRAAQFGKQNERPLTWLILWHTGVPSSVFAGNLPRIPRRCGKAETKPN